MTNIAVKDLIYYTGDRANPSGWFSVTCRAGKDSRGDCSKRTAIALSATSATPRLATFTSRALRHALCNRKRLQSLSRKDHG